MWPRFSTVGDEAVAPGIKRGLGFLGLWMLTSGRFLYCRGRCYSTLCVVQSDAEAPEETKSIGLVGGAALASLELVHKPYILAKVGLVLFR